MVRSSDELPEVVREIGAEIGMLAVPVEAAQENYDALVAAGIRAILNFAPVQLQPHPAVRMVTLEPLERMASGGIGWLGPIA